jgi:hypothetical protein
MVRMLGRRGECGLGLDDIDCGDPIERLLGDRRLPMLRLSKEPAAAMGPQCGQIDVAANPNLTTVPKLDLNQTRWRLSACRHRAANRRLFRLG